MGDYFRLGVHTDLSEATIREKIGIASGTGYVETDPFTIIARYQRLLAECATQPCYLAIAFDTGVGDGRMETTGAGARAVDLVMANTEDSDALRRWVGGWNFSVPDQGAAQVFPKGLMLQKMAKICAACLVGYIPATLALWPVFTSDALYAYHGYNSGTVPP